jgi:hypothetical protein
MKRLGICVLFTIRFNSGEFILAKLESLIYEYDYLGAMSLLKSNYISNPDIEKLLIKGNQFLILDTPRNAAKRQLISQILEVLGVKRQKKFR